MFEPFVIITVNTKYSLLSDHHITRPIGGCDTEYYVTMRLQWNMPSRTAESGDTKCDSRIAPWLIVSVKPERVVPGRCAGKAGCDISVLRSRQNPTIISTINSWTHHHPPITTRWRIVFHIFFFSGAPHPWTRAPKDSESITVEVVGCPVPGLSITIDSSSFTVE